MSQCPNEKPGASLTARKPGGQPGNGNAGLHHWLKCSMLPKGCARIDGETQRWRMHLEDEHLARGGELESAAECLINTAVRAERHARLTAKHLRQQAATLSTQRIISYSREVVEASMKRDKALIALRDLRQAQRAVADSRPTTAWDIIDGVLVQVPVWPTVASPLVRELRAKAVQNGNSDTANATADRVDGDSGRDAFEEPE